MARPPYRRLPFRLGAALVVGAAAVFAAAGVWNLRLQRSHLMRLVEDHGNESAEIIRRATRQAMLRDDPGEVQRILDTVASDATVERIRIYDKLGRIRRSTTPGEAGSLVDVTAEQCVTCHRSGEPLTQLDQDERARVFEGPEGGRLLGVILPIHNETACSQAACHAHPPSQRLLGVLDVQITLAEVDRDLAASERQMLAGLGAALFAVLLVAWALTWRMVLRPVARLTDATVRLAGGDFSERIPVESQDEIGAMTEAWNSMTDRLGDAHHRLAEWNRTLEERVEAKTHELSETHRRMLLIEKMASLGKLAAVVAHELNNPLTGIGTYARLLRKRFARQPEIAKAEGDLDRILGLIESESGRCGKIVTNLLLFSRTPGARFAQEELAPLVDRCFLLLRHKAELAEIALVAELPPDLPRAECDASQVQQMLLALILNAMEASSAGDTVRVAAHGEGDELVIRVIDQGRGIPPECLDKVFEPFFTTKEEGHGVGLGLAVVYGIVERHRGTIVAASDPRSGTVFTARLPLRQPAGTRTPEPEPTAVAASHGGGETA